MPVVAEGVVVEVTVVVILLPQVEARVVALVLVVLSLSPSSKNHLHCLTSLAYVGSVFCVA